MVGSDHRSYELFELDILGNNGRIRILDGGQVIQFENVISDKYYSGYKNLALEKEHKGTYGQFMKYGLERGLSEGGHMPGLEDELKVQTLIQDMLNATGLK